jgi:hypothetical protein
MLNPDDWSALPASEQYAHYLRACCDASNAVKERDAYNALLEVANSEIAHLRQELEKYATANKCVDTSLLPKGGANDGNTNDRD